VEVSDLIRVEEITRKVCDLPEYNDHCVQQATGDLKAVLRRLREVEYERDKYIARVPEIQWQAERNLMEKIGPYKTVR
jgi:hypothetical protein